MKEYRLFIHTDPTPINGGGGSKYNDTVFVQMCYK